MDKELKQSLKLRDDDYLIETINLIRYPSTDDRELTEEQVEAIEYMSSILNVREACRREFLA